MNAPLFRKFVPGAVSKMADQNVLRDQAAKKLLERRAAEAQKKAEPAPRRGM